MNEQGGRRKAEGGRLLLKQHSTPPFYFPLPPSPLRLGLTLIELLITITILATLAALFLGASNAAMESARAARTKTTISKIHTLLMERLDSYTTRRVEVNGNIESAINNSFPPSDRGKAMADVRLLALREVMKLEMPDRWSDVLLNAVPNSSPLTATQGIPVLVTRPSISLAYLRRYYALTTDDGVVVRRNQGAECLYMIVMLFTGDGEARTLFSRQDIGDTDGDGAQEFLDGWGNPIQFVRWPAGFVSDLQPVDPTTGLRPTNSDHDPFDMFRRDQEGVTTPNASSYPSPLDSIISGIRTRNNTDQISAYRLVPLVYSQGADSDSDVLVDTGTPTGLDPYAFAYGSTNNQQLGTTVDVDNNGEGWHDNIHNHLLDNR